MNVSTLRKVALFAVVICFTAAAYAQLGGMPMLMITGQKPVKASKQGHFQIVDIVDMMKPLTKYTRQIVSADARTRPPSGSNATPTRDGALTTNSGTGDATVGSKR